MTTLQQLARDLGRASQELSSALYDVYESQGQHFADHWRRNATATAGVHGRHYPKSITSEMRIALGIEVEVGPDSSMRQGGMSFELGSSKQPPHLDGARALPAHETQLERRADAEIQRLMP